MFYFATGLCVLSFVSILNATAEIFSLFGQKLYSCTLKEKQTRMDLSDFQYGIYLVVLTSQTGVNTCKFLKNK
ncbi:MAG: T9SS type A sorting domain-containing protein [Bacteroidia bacterium]|nr:T9SS type A sorting domain-containing protein [Bacteroidia bacterium]